MNNEYKYSCTTPGSKEFNNSFNVLHRLKIS